MQKNVQISENIFIQDLGTGHSLINVGRTVMDTENGTVIIAEQQYRVKNPATYASVVNEIVKQNYLNGADEAALRKGILNPNDADFIEFNSFVEQIKNICKNEIVQ